MQEKKKGERDFNMETKAFLYFCLWTKEDGNWCVQKQEKDAFFFYVTDGNIMYLTDASRSLISCVIQHYAPVVGWGGGGTDA
jgi:hypothetical protein